MIKSFTLFCSIFFCTIGIFAQQIFFGTHNYIEYQRGNLPIVISVPHGGSLDPNTIPDRICYNPVTINDLYTQEMALQIGLSLYGQTGCYPHIILCHLKRSKLDCNRDILMGACENPIAGQAWTEYHTFIDTAQNIANFENSNNIFFIDLHGHGKPYQRIELGYLLYGFELELPDSILNTSQYISRSSIQNLAENNSMNYSHAELLRGENSLGTLLTNRGYPSVPGQQMPSPTDSMPYYRGGYSTYSHTCFIEGNNVNGVQMELNYTGIRDLPENRKRFADSLALVLVDFLSIHRNVMMTDCGFYGEITYKNVEIFPNPLDQSKDQINIIGLPWGQYEYSIINMLGQISTGGTIENNKIVLKSNLPSNIYLLIILDKNQKAVYITKLLAK